MANSDSNKSSVRGSPGTTLPHLLALLKDNATCRSYSTEQSRSARDGGGTKANSRCPEADLCTANGNSNNCGVADEAALSAIVASLYMHTGVEEDSKVTATPPGIHEMFEEGFLEPSSPVVEQVTVEELDHACQPSRENQTHEDTKQASSTVDLRHAMEEFLIIRDKEIKENIFKGLTSKDFPNTQSAQHEISDEGHPWLYLEPEHNEICLEDAIEEVNTTEISDSDLFSFSGNHEEGKKIQVSSVIIEEESPKLSAENDEKLTCALCYKTFTYKKSLQKHLVIHAGSKYFSCDTCVSKIWRKDGLGQHELRRHASNESFPCELCGFKFAFRYELKRHMHMHTGKKEIFCPICNYTFTRKNSLKRHMFKHNGEKKYWCSYCNAAFARKCSLKQHMVKHSDDKKFACSNCDSKFKTNQALKVHVVSSHLEHLQFLCKFCDIKFQFKKEFSLHLTTHAHANEKPFPCNVCYARFESSQKRDKHKLVHTARRLFCNICNTAFKHKSNLVVHIKRHENQNQHSCFLCTASFSRKSYLEAHMLAHANHAQFSCNLCNARFKFKESLKRHMPLAHMVSGADCTFNLNSI